MKAIPEYASVILLTANNEIVLQLRDDNPNIVDPNCLSLFAGRLLDSELPEDGARREIRDETTLELGELTFFMSYKTTVERHGRISVSHAFICTNIDVDKIEVLEGQGYRLIQNAKDLKKHDFALISKDILEEYFARV